MLAVENQILIQADIQRVWETFIKIREWPAWWPACEEARVLDGDLDTEGSHLYLKIHLAGRVLVAKPEMERIRPAQEFEWLYRTTGVLARHLWRFSSKGNATQVLVREEFSGWGLPVIMLLGIPGKSRQMFEECLRGLKNKAEQP